MRRQFGQRLAEIEIVLELLALGLLAVPHLGRHCAVRPHLLAQAADQVGILGETLDQDGARAVERGRGIGDLLLRIDERRGRGRRILRGIGEQQIGQRLQPRLLGDFGLGAALRLERQIDVFQTPLGVGRHDGRLQRGVELALFADRFQDRGAALFQLAQIGQALFQSAQLRVVERAGDFLAVSRDERHGGAAVEQRHGRLDLLFANPKLFRNLPIDVCHAISFLKPSRRMTSRRAEVGYGPSALDSSTRRLKQIVLWTDDIRLTA